MALPFEAASVTAAEAEAHSAEDAAELATQLCGIVLANATRVNDCTINGVYKKGTDSDRGPSGSCGGQIINQVHYGVVVFYNK